MEKKGKNAKTFCVKAGKKKFDTQVKLVNPRGGVWVVERRYTDARAMRLSQ